MIDAHYHRNTYDTFLVHDGNEVSFLGIHPWECAASGASREALWERLESLRGRVAADSRVGVGEIGLDRLKTKTVPNIQREIFAAQLEVAAKWQRPVVLHGAKCWGEVVQACRPYAGRIPAFLFHGFSRSAGLLPEIIALNGFISVGPALLNDHAVNYHTLVRELPWDRVLLETDKDWSASQAAPTETPTHDVLWTELLRALAKLRACSLEYVKEHLGANVTRFVEALG